MNKELFDILLKLEKGQPLNDNELNFVRDNGYLSLDNKINEEGLKALEPYRVKRAIIMAAGFGSRMVPITLTTPKPLVEVNGVRIIETLIDKILKAGIKDIYIIRGYLKKEFDCLLENYPFIKFIDNDDFYKENNISSAIRVVDLFEDTYFCEADFVCKGDDIIEKYQYESNYLGTLVEETDDWCFDVDKDRYISNYRKGGKRCAQAFGISYWTKKDGKLLAQRLKEMYADENNRQEFWEMCIFEKYKEDFPIKCRFCKKDSILEIDSFDELIAVDSSYKITNRRKIGVVGFGNLGSILATKFSLKNDVVVYKNVDQDEDEYDHLMTVECPDDHVTYSAKIKLLTPSLKTCVDFADYIFITFPSFLCEDLAKEMLPLLRKGQHLIFIPGSGGAEFYFHDAIKMGCTISGLQRVHSVARILEKDKLVRESGKKSLLKVGSIPASYNPEACELINDLYGIKIYPLENYLNITLINSNAILHTSRLYNLFSDYKEGKFYNENPLFYETWNDETSQLLSDMDDELTSLFNELEKHGYPVKDIPGILAYYDSETVPQMTAKIRSIGGFKGLYSPMVEKEPGKFIPDFNSRYFTADFPFGLDIILEFLKLFNLKKESCELVSNWFNKECNPKRRFKFESFGIHSIDDLLEFYK